MQGQRVGVQEEQLERLVESELTELEAQEMLVGWVFGQQPGHFVL